MGKGFKVVATGKFQIREWWRQWQHAADKATTLGALPDKNWPWRPCKVVEQELSLQYFEHLDHRTSLTVFPHIVSAETILF